MGRRPRRGGPAGGRADRGQGGGGGNVAHESGAARQIMAGCRTMAITHLSQLTLRSNTFTNPAEAHNSFPGVRVRKIKLRLL